MLIALIGAALAGEGMWEPAQVAGLGPELAKAGFAGDAAQLARLDVAPLGAVVSLGGFCTASFVSPDGLLVTNHHCVTGFLQQASREGEDLIDAGFVAADRASERNVGPSGRVLVTTDVRDVTAEVVGKLPPKLPDAERSERIEDATKKLVAACEKPSGVRCRVASFYGGATYRLITQRELLDVRLVMAPPDSVGNYGDEIDNWHWPRHAGDFAFLRAYVGKDGAAAGFAADNVPYRPAQTLAVNPGGVSPGGFVMVAGYPGGTDRWRTAEEFEREATRALPRSILEQQFLLDTFADVAKADPAAGPILEPGRLSIANGMFNGKGTLEGFARSGVVAKAKARDAAIDAWVAADPSRSARYAPALTELRATLAAADARFERDVLLRYMAYASDLYGAATTIVTRAHERQKSDAKRRPGYQDRDEARTRGSMASMQRGIQLEADRRAFAHALERLAALPDCPPELKTWLGLEAGADVKVRVAEAVARLYANPPLAREADRVGYLDLPLAKLPKDDAFVSLAFAMHPFIERERAEGRARDGALARLRPVYVEALRNALPARAYPDANGTLRVTFGTVQGYRPFDGALYTPQTTLEGLAAKAGAWPFDAAPAHLAAITAGKHGAYGDPTLGSVPVDFLSDLDITGGNSGSPTLDKDGRLVGLAFDGNYEGIASDWFFDANVARTIHVDVRYVLWYLDAVAQADHVLRELGQVPSL